MRHRFIFVDKENGYFKGQSCYGRLVVLLNDSYKVHILDLNDLVVQTVELGDVLTVSPVYFLKPLMHMGKNTYELIYEPLSLYMSDKRMKDETIIQGLPVEFLDSAVMIRNVYCGLSRLHKHFTAVDHGQNIWIFDVLGRDPSCHLVFMYRRGNSLIMAYQITANCENRACRWSVSLMYDFSTQEFQGYHFYGGEDFLALDTGFKEPKLAKEILRW